MPVVPHKSHPLVLAFHPPHALCGLFHILTEAFQTKPQKPELCSHPKDPLWHIC